MKYKLVKLSFNLDVGLPVNLEAYLFALHGVNTRALFLGTFVLYSPLRARLQVLHSHVIEVAFVYLNLQSFRH